MRLMANAMRRADLSDKFIQVMWQEQAGRDDMAEAEIFAMHDAADDSLVKAVLQWLMVFSGSWC